MGVGAAGGISVRCWKHIGGESGSRRGSQGTRAAALIARSFFLKGLLCFQGRDASDQHIVDVVLKMLQGEGRGQQALPHRLGQGITPRQESLHVPFLQCLESWVLIPALPLRAWGPSIHPCPLWPSDLSKRPEEGGG